MSCLALFHILTHIFFTRSQVSHAYLNIGKAKKKPANSTMRAKSNPLEGSWRRQLHYSKKYGALQYSKTTVLKCRKKATVL
jgi:hypothetical protein